MIPQKESPGKSVVVGDTGARRNSKKSSRHTSNRPDKKGVLLDAIREERKKLRYAATATDIIGAALQHDFLDIEQAKYHFREIPKVENECSFTRAFLEDIERRHEQFVRGRKRT